ncbi:ribonuclease E/G [Novosphingobium jiangmenense]|uniref:Ribonuclease E/G n=1 Tax=Novosphingobium jiangmenense TaxID=2791981 RepID=A0ABS0HEK8_9SPHN|nr:ribonuclease E/G [Novosphingobium jiangmenense]MBF9150657.1 ribonuclease E/G [Novosphingobium jiangmenense]
MSADWLHEAGIGEERAILVSGGRILSARVCWGESLRPGLVAQARLVKRHPGSRRGVVRFEDGAEALIDQLPREATEGVTLTVRVTRAAIAERGRTKLPVVRSAPGEAPRPAPTLREELEETGASVKTAAITGRAFTDNGWDELVEQAITGEVSFAGGSIIVSPTPAMTLIDVDGALPPLKLALAAVDEIADALHRLDIGGSVGIDFPTLHEKKDRQHVDKALGDALIDWQGERTAMNGFGFVHLVSRLERASLVARYARYPASAAARALLRQAERVTEPGALLLAAHPRVLDAIQPEWEAELARRSGRTVRRKADPALALSGGFAQGVPL